MDSEKKCEGVSRLTKLAADLNEAYTKAARYVANRLMPLESAIQQVDETWLPDHYAEGLQNQEPNAVRHRPACFARETFVSGDEANYALCVARDRDRKCALYVSVCKYHVVHRQKDEGDENGANAPAEITIKNQGLVPLSSLPVPLRVKVLDVVDEFAQAYEEHVREARKTLLQGWDGEVDATSLGTEPEVAEDETPTSNGPAEAPQHDADTPPQKRSKRRFFSKSPDSAVPLKAWVRTKA